MASFIKSPPALPPLFQKTYWTKALFSSKKSSLSTRRPSVKNGRKILPNTLLPLPLFWTNFLPLISNPLNRPFTRWWQIVNSLLANLVLLCALPWPVDFLDPVSLRSAHCLEKKLVWIGWIPLLPPWNEGFHKAQCHPLLCSPWMPGRGITCWGRISVGSWIIWCFSKLLFHRWPERHHWLCASVFIGAWRNEKKESINWARGWTGGWIPASFHSNDRKYFCSPCEGKPAYSRWPEECFCAYSSETARLNTYIRSPFWVPWPSG